MRIRTIVLVVVLLVMAFGLGRLSAAAPSAPGGNLDSPGPPGSTSSYTLEDIYDRLDSGAAGTQSTFAEPAAGPTTGTGHTLNEVYDLIGLRAPVPKTGQTTCYDWQGNPIACAGTGQDGEYQKGVTWPTPRFITSTAGIVTDTLTGLIWLQDASCSALAGTNINGEGDWATALSAANSLADGTCGLSDGSSAGDWRLPNVREMQSLTHYEFSFPALPNTAGTGQWTTQGDPFTGVTSAYYWTSTTNTRYLTHANLVSFVDGHASYDIKITPRYVWPVRGGQ